MRNFFVGRTGIDLIVRADYGGMFIDRLSIKLLYEGKEIFGYCNEHDRMITKFEAARWVMLQWYNISLYNELKMQNRYAWADTPEKLYKISTEYRKAVDEERLYLLYLMEIPRKDIADCFGITRQTVYNRVKAIEKNRLCECLRNYW